MNACEKVKLKTWEAVHDPINREAHLEFVEYTMKLLKGEVYVFKMNQPKYENQIKSNKNSKKQLNKGNIPTVKKSKVQPVTQKVKFRDYKRCPFLVYQLYLFNNKTK